MGRGPKKKNQVKANLQKKLLNEEKESRKKDDERIERRKERLQKEREKLMKKLQDSAGSDAPAAEAAGSADVEMRGTGAKKKGVIRKIGKVKASAKVDKSKAKALLKFAKGRKDINMDEAKKLLLGTKKPTLRPNGTERLRDKRIRKKREQRERRGYTKRKEGDGSMSEDLSA
eukprot:TRINITY_DN55791_c0_g1_i1.p2 TRINITY_DN55791_c0_g1~~TRINITY_DN55791_c0_g1_i1.p2  ORF type:complete len:173 (-),score=60.14 TRINITY_DN55791_c0_g1_i1:80-598(-)